MNAPEVSNEFELGAPSFERRLAAARKAQEAGYRVRVRLDPIVPLDDWHQRDATTIAAIFDAINPERITVGTLRFEESFWRQRKALSCPGSRLVDQLDSMTPMFDATMLRSKRSPISGERSRTEEKRHEVFSVTIDEIRKH